MSEPAVDVDRARLRCWPLPQAGPDADKEDRGRTLVVAGSAEMPGAALLAATAAMRAGAGRLTVATGARVAAGLALAMPEARVIGLPESERGGFVAAGIAALEGVLDGIGTGAILIGPGLQDPPTTLGFVEALLQRRGAATVVLDALAMDVVVDRIRRFDAPVLLTPHAGEMAHLAGLSKDAVLADPDRVCRDAAARWNAIVALKGPCTRIATPDGRLWRHTGGNAGLATSGSGDVLAGLVAGLASRGAAPEQALVFGVALHGQAGCALAQRFGTLGYLARELAAEVPPLMHALAAAPA